MLVCDTSALIAFFDRSDVNHARVTAVIEQDDGPFVVSPYVVAELDYLLATRVGVAAELAALESLTSGAWELPSFGRDDVAKAREVVARYADQDIGVTDASIVVLAARYETNRILTLDHRHFDVVRTLANKPFRVLPR